MKRIGAGIAAQQGGLLDIPVVFLKWKKDYPIHVLPVCIRTETAIKRDRCEKKSNAAAMSGGDIESC